MAPGVARLYAMSLRGCGRECDVMPVIKVKKKNMMCVSNLLPSNLLYRSREVGR